MHVRIWNSFLDFWSGEVVSIVALVFELDFWAFGYFGIQSHKNRFVSLGERRYCVVYFIIPFPILHIFSLILVLPLLFIGGTEMATRSALNKIIGSQHNDRTIKTARVPYREEEPRTSRMPVSFCGFLILSCHLL